MEKPPFNKKPNGKIIYFLNRDLKTILKRKERGLIKHYILNIIEMKKESYYERELDSPVRGVNKNTLTKYFNAYEELGVFDFFRTEKGIGLSLPYYYPETDQDWLIVGGGYFKLNVEETKKAMNTLSDNAFRLYLTMKMNAFKLSQLTIRKIESIFNWSVKTIKLVLKSLNDFLFGKEVEVEINSFEGKENHLNETKEKKPSIDVMSLFNEAINELKFKKREKSSLNPHEIKGLDLNAFERLIKKGQVLRKEVQIGISRFSEYLNSSKNIEKIANPGGYLYQILKKNGRYIPPESWILSQNTHEKGDKMVQIDSFFEQNSREEEEDFNMKKKKALEFLNHIKYKAV
jgi:hypothetical protein